MDQTKLLKFTGVLGIQVLILVGIILYKLIVLGSGTEILLQIQPIDPRDPLRGDYATFSYSISNQPFYDSSINIQNGDTVYVPLYKSGKYWISEGLVSKSKPERGVFIKGRVVVGGSSGQLSFDSRQGNLNISYGIEQYFIPEGKGRALNNFNGEAYAKVAIDEEGNSVLKGIYLNDNPWP